MIKHFEETEGNRKIIADLSEGSNVQLEHWVQRYRKLSGLDDERLKILAEGIKRFVEARRRGRGSGIEHTTKNVLSSQEATTMEMDEKDVMDGVEEMRTGRGCIGLVRGREDKRQTNETSADETNSKGKGTENGGKGEHGGEGEHGSKAHYRARGRFRMRRKTSTCDVKNNF